MLGEEGDGKTWSVASWLSWSIKKTEKFPAVLFYSSTDIPNNDPSSLLSSVISKRISQITEEQSQKRLSRWKSRTEGELPLLLIVLDGINEHRSHQWWRTLLESLEGKDWKSQVAIIITSRSSYWEQYFRSLTNISAQTFTIQPYNEAELKTALANYNLRPQDIEQSLFPIICKPRYFDLMVKLRERIAESGDITVARLVYEDWRDRLERKRNIELTNQAFQDFICKLAADHQLRSASFSDIDIDENLPAFSDNKKAIFEELSTGGILIPQGRGNYYKVDERLLKYAFGLLLVDQLEHNSEGDQDFKEIIASWLEPHAEMDIKATICEFAALHALGLTNFPRAAKVALLQAWLNSRNPEQGADINLVAYLPKDPQSYIELAAELWAELHENVWAQEFLIRAFLKHYSLPHVASVLHSTFKHWLGYVNISGSPYRRSTEQDKTLIKQEIEKRLGFPIKPGAFTYANYEFMAIEDDALLNLGRIAIIFISYLPRGNFIEAISIGCVAEAIMGRPENYDLYGWTIRTSPTPIWSEIKKAAEQLLSVNTLVTQQAAYRLLSFESSKEGYQLQQRIPEDIFPPNQYFELYKQDPCESGFAWSEEDCIKCLQREDLEIAQVLRQIAPHCIDPKFLIPEKLKLELPYILDTIDSKSLWILLVSTSADLDFERYEPVLLAKAPDSLADYLCLQVRQIDERKGMALRQFSIYLIRYYLIFQDRENLVIKQIWENLIESYENWGEPERLAQHFLFKLVLRHTAASEQLSYLLSCPDSSDFDSLDYENAFLPITNWEEVERQFAGATTPTKLIRCLWFISENPAVIPTEFLNKNIVPLIEHEDKTIRAFTLQIIYEAREKHSSQIIINGSWKWEPKIDVQEGHWGSLLFCEQGEIIPFEDLRNRIHPNFLGYAIKHRGKRKEEIQKLVEIINEDMAQVSNSPFGVKITYDPDDLEMIFELYPEVISQWADKVLAPDVEVKFLRSSFCIAFCIALLKQDLNKGIELCMRLDEVEANSREINKALFNTAPNETLPNYGNKNLKCVPMMMSLCS